MTRSKERQRAIPAQRDRSALLVELQSSLAHFPVALARAAKYVLENPEKVVHQPLAEVSSFSGSGQATILRLCRELGFSGYTDFRIALSAELAISASQRTSTGEEGDELDRVVAQINASVADTRALIEPDVMKRCAEKLRSAQRTDVFGVGVSGMIAEMIGYRLLRAGCNALALRDPVLAHEVSGGLSPQTAAIAVSQSGSTPETIKFVQNARNAGAFTIALTCHPRSALARSAHVTLTVARLNAASFGGPITDIPRAVVVAEALAMAILQD